MILGVLLGFAALAVVSSIIGSGETQTNDPAGKRSDLNMPGRGTGSLPNNSADEDRSYGSDGDDLILGLGGDDDTDTPRH